MANGRPIAGNIVIIGAAAIAVVVVLLGVLNRDTLFASKIPDSPIVTAPQPAVGTPGGSATAAATSPQSPAPAAVEAGKPAGDATAQADEPAGLAPTFDIVRVEPNGESVIAGRSTPGATIELLRNDQVHARAVADNSGLFALTPPPLPEGSHKIVLQSIAPDGKRQRSKESVTVEINGSTRPLVALHGA